MILPEQTTVHDFGLPQQPLMDGPSQGRFGLLCLDGTDDRLTTAKLRSYGEPYLIVMQTTLGPGRYCSARAIRRWSRICVVHATVERRGDYEWIAGLVDEHRRVTCIETLPHIGRTWLAFMEREVATVALLAEAPR